MTQTIGDRYEIQRSLGQRPGRRTVLALDSQTGRRVVVKQLWLSDSVDWQALKLFEREADVLKTLSHPNLPRYLDYLELSSEAGPSFALVQSYVRGRSLEARLMAGLTFAESDMKALAQSVLKILIYLHSLTPPIIHRDIKPSNLVLSDRSGNSLGEVYLVDFGSVQTLAAQAGGTITVVGTYGYMPPEQFGGRVVPASDLYSLGATLIFLATGRHPSELPQHHLQLQFRPLAGLSPGFADWLEWMTDPSLSRRFNSAQAALDALDAPPRRPSAAVKPADSQVRLTQTPESLMLVAAHNDWRDYFSFLGLTAITVSGLLFGWSTVGKALGLAAIPPQNLFSGLVIGGLFIALALLMLRQQRLKITPRYITKVVVIGGIPWRRNRTSRAAIDRIMLRGSQQRTSYHQVIRMPAKLTIWAGRKAFALNEGLLTEADLYWLADEISCWLGLPLTIEADSQNAGEGFG